MSGLGRHYTTDVELHKAVWQMRHGGATTAEVARRFGVTASRVRQITEEIDRCHERALRRIDSPTKDPYTYDIWFHFGPGEKRLPS